MTDEEIEKALHCIKGEELPCKDCSYHVRQFNCRAFVIADTLDYIKRLKSENAEAKELCKKKVGDLKVNEWIRIMTAAGYEVTAISLTEHVEQIRKETAKEVLQKVRKHYPPSREDTRATLDDCYMLDVLDDIAKQYGVEVDND